MGQTVGEQGNLSWLNQVARRLLTASGLVQWAKLVKRQIYRKPGAPYMAEEDREKEHSGNNFKVSIIK